MDLTTGFTQAEVEAILAANKAELLNLNIQMSQGGSAVTRRRLDEVAAIIAACQRALRVIAPDTYAKPKRRNMQSQMPTHFAH